MRKKMSFNEKATIPECYWNRNYDSQRLIKLVHDIPCVAAGIPDRDRVLQDFLRDNKTPICEHLRLEDLVAGKRKRNLRVNDGYKPTNMKRCKVAFCITYYGFVKTPEGFIVLWIQRVLGNGVDAADPCWLGAMIR